MALRLATAADEVKILEVCANSAWPEHLPGMLGEWDHTAWLALFGRPENIVIVNTSGQTLNAVCAFTITRLPQAQPDSGPAVPDLVIARLVCLPIVLASVGPAQRYKLAAQTASEGLRQCALQGATRIMWAYNPGPLIDRLKAVNIAFVHQLFNGTIVSFGDEDLALVRTKLATVA